MDPSSLSQIQEALGADFQIVRELGGGGMSRVFMAREIRLARDVVIKVLPPDLAAGIKTERFEREIKLAARLQHPHIVPILSAGSADGILYYTMPFVDGPSLAARLKDESPIPIAEATAILRDVADALSFAHSERVIHRDIKPQNILLRSHHALVLDFGVAKALSEAAEQSITSTGLAIGTPLYMAPEQAVADPDVDERADIYSLGVVAYETLAGRAPFRASTAQALMAAHVTVRPVELHQVNEAVPLELSHVVMRCLEKNPQDRWQSAEELCEAFNEFAARFTPPRHSEANATNLNRDAEPERTSTADKQQRDVRFSVRKAIANRQLVRSVVLVAVILLVIWWSPLIRNRRDTAPSPSVAILPFENLDTTDTTAYFAAGLTRELATTLGKLQGLRVASLTSSTAAREHEGDIRRIASRLNVSDVVEGNVRHNGGSVVVTAQLTNGRTGFETWSAAFTDSTGNLIALQAKIARAIGTALVGRLVPRPGHRLDAERQIDPRAQDLVMYGRWLENDFNLPNLEEAINRYSLALSIDSSYAVAHASIANALYHLADDYYAPRNAYPRMRAEAMKAIRFDSTLADAYGFLAAYELSYGWDWKNARANLDRALMLDPQSPMIQMLQGWYLLITGNPAAGVDAALKASALDPFSDEIGGNVVTLLRAAGRHDLASIKIREMLNNDVGDRDALFSRLARESLAQSQPELARAQLDSALAIKPKCCRRTRAILLARDGYRDSALKFVEQLEAIRKDGYYRADYLAEARAALGDTARAFFWLEAAYKDRSQSFPIFPSSVELRPFEKDPRFVQLRVRLHLPQENRLSVAQN